MIELFDAGYVMPVQRNDIRVAGRSGLGALYAGINGMWRAQYATDHDVTVAKSWLTSCAVAISANPPPYLNNTCLTWKGSLPQPDR